MIPDIVHSHRFESVYQPILCPSHQKLVGFEALVRAYQNGTPVSPTSLFEVASEHQQSALLDRHLLDLHLSNFQYRGDPVWLFLNISPNTCAQPELSLERLAHQCRQLGIRTDSVVLELVEHTAKDPAAMFQFIDGARERGFQIAIDDFGMGDSNFERLWRIHPMIVKIDRSLLVNAESNTRARLLLQSLVRMIRESGSLVLLEGIETVSQGRIALATEADLLQGFLFARPQPLTSESCSGGAEMQMAQLVGDSTALSIQHSRDHDSYLRLLRFEIMEACHLIIRGTSFRSACERLLALDGVMRCFILDGNGVQQGNLARASYDIHQSRFNPLYESAGACWQHREYFLAARERPQRINCSRPYVALPDARRTVTLSTGVTVGRQQRFLCVDLHPDDLFDGHLVFPSHL